MSSFSSYAKSVQIPELEASLLLATARASFNKGQIEIIRQIASRIRDWEWVVDTSIKKFSAPYLQNAMESFASDLVPQIELQRLKAEATRMKFKTLDIAAAQLNFHDKCIAPAGIRHAYLKGICLSLQFNGAFADRFCRDIDVLVDSADYAHVIQTAANNGFRVVLSKKPLRFASTTNDLKVVAKFSGDVGLVSPNGTLIEVHRRLDKKSQIFDTDEALQNVESVELSGIQMQTLQRATHFNYVCYHHTRHFWSHLHWIADLDLIVTSPDFELGEALELSNVIGLRPTIEAAQEFHQLLTDPVSLNDGEYEEKLSHEFLKACLINLSGGLELEYKLRKNSYIEDFMNKSQLNKGKSRRLAFEFWQSKLRPLSSQYIKRPVPASLFWLYRVQRPINLILDWLTRGISKTVSDVFKIKHSTNENKPLDDRK